MSELFISQVKLPGSNDVYIIKDAWARNAIKQIEGGITFHKVSSAADTPLGVKWTPAGGEEITGELAAADAQKSWLYLVPVTNSRPEIYQEYIAVNEGTTEVPGPWAWETLGDTQATFDTGLLSSKLTYSTTPQTVLTGVSAEAAASAVSFSGGADDTFVKSYPGASSKLATTQITGVDGTETFNAVDSATDYTATNTVFGTNTEASKIETDAKVATSVTFGTANTASFATAGTAVNVASAGTAVGNVVTSSSAISAIVTGASVNGEQLEFSVISSGIDRTSITPAVANGTITPYTFENVTVPNITDHADVSFNAVKTNTAIAVPVVSSNAAVTTTKVTTASKTVAKKAASAITVATGSLNAEDANGDTVMTGLGNAVTASAITNIGTGTAAAQTITVTPATENVIKTASLAVDATAKVFNN